MEYVLTTWVMIGAFLTYTMLLLLMTTAETFPSPRWLAIYVLSAVAWPITLVVWFVLSIRADTWKPWVRERI